MNIIKKNIFQITLAVFIAIVGVICGVIPYFSVANIVEAIIENNMNFVFYKKYIFIIIAGLLGSVIFHQISTLISHNLAFKVIEDIRKQLSRKLTRLSMGDIEKKSSGEWTQFMVQTVDKLEQPIAHVIPEVIANIIIPVVLVIIIFIYDWRIGIANLLTLPLGFLFSCLMMNGYEEKSLNYQIASKKMNSTMVEYIRGIQVIKAFNKSASSYKKFIDDVKDNRDSMLNWYLSICFFMTAAMEIFPCTLLFVLPVSLFLYINGSILLGTLIMCVLLSYASYRPLIKAMSHADTMANIRIIFSEIKDIMNTPEMSRRIAEDIMGPYDVKFENVEFGYTNTQKVLKNITFTANEKELTAIVGYSGSGKSTITKLIAGYYDVNNGKIQIGSVDLKNMSLEQNMEAVTYVSQENYLFHKSILENMQLAKVDASLEEIEEACKKASCHDFISQLPNGYNTVIGEEGGTLSGGERQRITIARALLKDSPIVLLDEATAYSDPDNEAEIQKSINALVKNKTVIMVAHRLSTIIHANKIIVLSNGVIEAEGTHQELLEKNKTYRKLWESHIGESAGEIYD